MLNPAATGVAWSCATGAECGTTHSHAMAAEGIGSNLENTTGSGSRRMQFLPLRPSILTSDQQDSPSMPFGARAMVDSH